MESSKNKVVGVLKESLRVEYGDGYEYCKRIIAMLMNIAPEKSRLLPMQREVLTAMCKLCTEGKPYGTNRQVMLEMNSAGRYSLNLDDVRNYRYMIKKKKWLVGKSLNGQMMKAISNGGLAVALFLKDAN